MKRNLAALLVGLVVIFSACKEIPPFISFEPPIELLNDTSYVSSQVPAAEDLNVLIEDISGVRCSNCPDAAKVAHDLLDQNPNRVVVSTIHPELLTTFTFPFSGEQDFRTDAGTNIVSELIGEPLGLPAGALNRTKFTGESFVAMSERNWPGHMATLLAQKSKVNLEFNVDADTSNRKATASMKVIFTEPIPDPVHLTVFVTESHIVQSQSTVDQGKVKDYEHNFILRSVVTPYFGVKLRDRIDKRGRTISGDLEIELDPTWKLKNCSIVAVINRHGVTNKEILQVTSYDLK